MPDLFGLLRRKKGITPRTIKKRILDFTIDFRKNANIQEAILPMKFAFFSYKDKQAYDMIMAQGKAVATKYKEEKDNEKTKTALF